MPHSGLFDTIRPLIVNIPLSNNSARTSPIIDMQGWSGIAFMAMTGANSGGTTTACVVSQSDSSTFAASTVIASGTITPGTAINTFGAFEVWRPTGRYVRVVSTPAGTVDWAMAGFLFGRTGTLPSGTAGTASIYTKLVVN